MNRSSRNGKEVVVIESTDIVYLVAGYVVGYLWATLRRREPSPGGSRRLEKKIDLLLDQAGIAYDLLEETGVELKEAKHAVDEAKELIRGRA